MEQIEIDLRAEKQAFLDKLENRIRIYIKTRGKNCIAVVERKADGSIRCTWDFHDDIDDLAKMVILFMRKKKAPSGCTLDSALTDPILDIVKEEYETFYREQSDNIAKGVLNALASDEIKLKAFVDRVSDIALSKVSSAARKQVVSLICHQINDSISQGAMHTVHQSVAHVATTTAAAQVANIVAHLLLKLLASHIGVLVAKVMASAALHNVIMLIAKKVVFTAVLTTVLHTLVAHFGAALAGASVMWILIPIFAGYLLYKMATFPEDLAKDVSRDVRKKLGDQFDGMNKTVLEKIFYSVFEGDDLVRAVANDPEFQRSMRTLGEKVEPGLSEINNWGGLTGRKGSRTGYYV